MVKDRDTKETKGRGTKIFRVRQDFPEEETFKWVSRN